MKRKFKQLLKQRKELEELLENSNNTLWAVNEEIKATCEHEEMVEKSTYYSGGYDYRDETNTGMSVFTAVRNSIVKQLMGVSVE